MQNRAPRIRRWVCLGQTIVKSFMRTPVWTETTPPDTAITVTEPTSSDPLLATTFTAPAKVRSPATAPRWLTELDWWSKTSSHRMDGCHRTWTRCSGNLPLTAVLFTQIRGATTPRPTPNGRGGSMPTLEPCRGPWPSSPRETAARGFSSPPTDGTWWPSAPAPNRSIRNGGVPPLTAPPKRGRTVSSCSHPERTSCPPERMGFGTPTTKTSALRRAAACQRRTPRALLRSCSNSTRTDGSPTKTTC